VSSSPQPPLTSPPPARFGSLALIAVGAIIMVGAVFADSLGLSGGGDGFGWKQLIAAIVGLVLLLSGLAWFLSPMLEEAEADEPLE
jgi:hypothetical protein